MIFEIGKFYKHLAGGYVSILCEAETTVRGNGFIAECAGKLTPCGFRENPDSDDNALIPTEYYRQELALVGKGVDNATGWTEVTKKEWMSNFISETL